MINFYAVLGIDKNADAHNIAAACDALRSHEPEIAEEAGSVLLDPEKRALYDQVHTQFNALALVNSRLLSTDSNTIIEPTEKPAFVDTNHWARRLVEFT